MYIRGLWSGLRTGRRWRRSTKILVAILVSSVVMRVGMALYLGDAIEEVRGGTYDQISYDLLAQRVAGGYGFSFPRDWWPQTRAGEPTAHWSYLYTLSLAGIYGLVGHHPLVARLIQAVVVGLLMPYLVYRLGRRAFGPRAGLIAAAIVAVYLYFAHYAASLMTESLYIVGLLWILDAAMRLVQEVPASEPGARMLGVDRRIWLGLELGLAMGLTLLLRQVIVLFLGVLVLWMLWVARRRGRLRRVSSPLLAAVLVVAMLILPWLVRNYRAFDLVTPMPNTNSGFAFFWCNHPIYGTRFEAVLSGEHGVTYQELIPEELRHLNEAALDRALLARGLAFVLDDPGRYLLLSLSRIPVYFLFWPTTESTLLSNLARVLSFGLFLPLMVAGVCLAISRLPAWYTPRRRYGTAQSSTRPGIASLASLTRNDRGEEVVGGSGLLRFENVVLCLLFIVVYTLIHLASWANVRYRLPVDAVLVIFAAYAMDRLVEAFLRRIGRGRGGDRVRGKGGRLREGGIAHVTRVKGG